VNILAPRGVQLVPFVDVAIVLVPDPTATQRLPFQAEKFADVVNTLVPPGLQLVPSVELAIEFVPLPVATHIDPFQAADVE
jgi:hypothetical protein